MIATLALVVLLAQTTNPELLQKARELAKAGDVDGAVAALKKIQPPAANVLGQLRSSPDFAAVRNHEEGKKVIAALRPCAGPEFRQFDFWLGDWKVVNAQGNPLGENTITLRHGDCVVQEEWRSAGGGSGTSFNFYDPRTKQWHQFWVDAGGLAWASFDEKGNPSTARGGLKDGMMELMSAPGTTPMVRGRWQKLPDGRVHQTYDQSTDGGKTWTNGFDGYYVRK
jgi:hypothetical protein